MAARKAGETVPAEIAAEIAPAMAAVLPNATTETTAAPATTISPAPRFVPAPAAQAAAVQAGFNTISTQEKTNMEKAMKTAEEMMSFGQGNLEAVVKSSQIWAAGMQDIGKQMAASAQAQMDQTMATLKALAAVKSFKEAVELQSSLARSSVEKAVTETGKLTDASLKLAEQTLAPITARVTLAAEKFGRAV